MPMSMVMLHVSWLNASHKITFNGFQLTKCILATAASPQNKRKIKENWQQVQVRPECHEFTVKADDGQISHGSLGIAFGHKPRLSISISISRSFSFSLAKCFGPQLGVVVGQASDTAS